MWLLWLRGGGVEGRGEGEGKKRGMCQKNGVFGEMYWGEKDVIDEA